MLLILLLLTLLQQEPTTVRLNGDYRPADITFAGTSGSIVDIRARSQTDEPIDVTLELLLGTRLIGFNDDHQSAADNLGERDAALVGVVLPADGEYTIRVNSFSGAQSGEVEIRIETREGLPTCTTPVQAGELRRDGRYGCTLDLSAGSSLTITARDTSGTLDPVLELRSEAGRVAFNDDHNGDDPTLNTLDARIDTISIDTAGVYSVYVSDFSGAAGTFELIFEITS